MDEKGQAQRLASKSHQDGTFGLSELPTPLRQKHLATRIKSLQVTRRMLDNCGAAISGSAKKKGQ
jgi:hypothetical protein